MRILYLIESLDAGGKERQLVELVKRIQYEKDFECIIGVKRKKVHYKGIFRGNNKVFFFSKSSKKSLKIAFGIYKLCKDFKPDIIHSKDIITSLYAIPVSKLFGIKFINGCIREAFPFRKLSKTWFISQVAFKFSDAIVANSLAGLKSNNLNLSKKAYYIYNGFDFSRVENLDMPVDIKKKLSIKTKYVVGMVANFSKYKDYRTFLISAKRIIEKRNDVTFMCIGDGTELKEIKLNVGSEFRTRIKFLGSISDVESVVNIFDIGVLTTNTKLHAEGFSNSIMEYMALSKPVIATNCGGNKELIVDEVTGFLIEPFADNELVRKIEMLLDNRAKRENMGEEGRRIMRNFSLDKMVGNYKKLYTSLIQERKRKKDRI